MNSKIIKAVALATGLFFAFTAEGCPGDNRATKAGNTKVFTADGSYTITKARVDLKIKAINPPASCKWYVFYDIGSDNKKAIILKQGNEKNAWVNLGDSHWVTNSKTHKRYKLQGTSFSTENCGTWVKR